MHVYPLFIIGQRVYLLTPDGGTKLTIHTGTVEEITATLSSTSTSEPAIRYAVRTDDGKLTCVWEAEGCIVSRSASGYVLRDAIEAKLVQDKPAEQAGGGEA